VTSEIDDNLLRSVVIGKSELNRQKLRRQGRRSLRIVFAHCYICACPAALFRFKGDSGAFERTFVCTPFTSAHANAIMKAQKASGDWAFPDADPPFSVNG
jgi:hypothetical protein